MASTPAKLAAAQRTDAGISNQQDEQERERLFNEIKTLKIQLAAAGDRYEEEKKRRSDGMNQKAVFNNQEALDKANERMSRNHHAGEQVDINGTTLQNQIKDDRKAFQKLGPDENGLIPAAAALKELENCGLLKDDTRLSTSFAELSLVGEAGMTFEEFRHIKNESLLLDRAFMRKLAIPDFQGFTNGVKACFDETYDNKSGAVAGYIPQLARVNPEQYGVAVCTVDGQRWSYGDSRVPFCIQSSSKPLTYAMALELHGEEEVHTHIGREPSGRNFNSRVLLNSGVAKGGAGHGSSAISYRHIPHNPCINAGAIMAASLVKGEVNEADRFDYVINMWKRLAGNKRVSFQNSTYMGERATAARNFCLGYMMTEEEAFPEENDLIKTLESYFMYCSIEMDAEAMAIVAGTLANGGVCPITGERVFQAETVKKTLTLVQSCGMYDYSGEFAFKVGFPSKSGVSGVLCIVIPGVTGIATFSPRLDELGNSVRGLDFCKALNSRFPFHQFATLQGCHKGKDITSIRINSDLYTDLWFACADGDVHRIKQLVSLGVNVNIADYDRRSALHLAASNGHTEAVRYLLSVSADKNYMDLHGNTPADDALRHNRKAVVELLGGSSTSVRTARRPSLVFKSKLALGQIFLNRLWCSSAITRTDSKTGKIFHKSDLQAAILRAGIDYTALPLVKKVVDELPEFFNNLCFLKTANATIINDADFTISKALSGTLVVPNWPLFTGEMAKVFEAASNFDPGPDQHPNRFFPSSDGDGASGPTPDVQALGVCTIDGQQLSFGAADHTFTAQSLARPLLYCMATEKQHGGVGREVYDQFVGREPAPSDATDIELNPSGQPFNCMTMSGGVMTCSLIDSALAPRIKMNKLLQVWSDCSGGNPTKVCESTLQHELDHSNKHKCVTYMMRETGVLTKDLDVSKLLDYYFMTNSIECNVKSLSILAATLAFGGICPTTQKRIFQPETVKNCLCMMYSAGMDSQSGEFAFKCGLPAKGGRSGAILIVIPNVMGACYYAPQINRLGQPSRGGQFCVELVSRFNFHFYDKIIRGSSEKMNPLLYDMTDKRFYIIQLLNAASEGDIMAIKNLHSLGVKLDDGDYDMRTAAHLAASKGESEVLQHLAMLGANMEPIDRWGNRPMDDAKRNGHTEVAAKLAGWLGTAGGGQEKPDTS
jgi:glutaminase